MVETGRKEIPRSPISASRMTSTFSNVGGDKTQSSALSCKRLKMDNKVELLGYYGSDEVIACSTWTSTSRNLTDEKRGRIPDLLKCSGSTDMKRLLKKAQFTLVDTDIAGHIICLNIALVVLMLSQLDKELKEDKYYIPDDWPKVAAERCLYCGGKRPVSSMFSRTKPVWDASDKVGTILRLTMSD